MGICKDLQDFGRGFVRLWERICGDLQGFLRICETLEEDSWGFLRICETLGEDLQWIHKDL